MKRCTVMVLVLVLVLAVVSGMGLAGHALQLGITARVPPVLSVQVRFLPSFALEAGLAATGPLLIVGKFYPPFVELGGVLLQPLVGIGMGLVFLPGDNVASGFYGLAGMEYAIPDTALTAIGELGITLPPSLNLSEVGVGATLGLRLDF